ncbi:putative G patch domain-containing protein 1-like [Apostichopus japonicus]|uniref:Putative G patch domain-containing protein 1-like n=1 Tax=Stichopus japonicus TaxID=307972 RepID=A0A2G8LP75_STIJA|nr:putative G patch domain-containing protein 1-like [Apostichopus japonicus]
MTSDDDDDGESFFTYGEPLDDDEDGPKLNLTAVENQVVKDEQGRRRFHGAFTGGFSAGYFNSVGSKEGWTPSTFVSSRSNKNEGKKNQIAEDFMDDEDLGEYGIAPRKLKTADKFTSSARVPKRSGDDETSTIPGLAPLNDLVTVTNASIGAQILKRMGWREGQGVGPKVRKYKKKKSKGKLGNKDEQGGESIPTSEAEKCEDEMSNFLFGPDDVQQFLFQMKSDQKGLGYSGINRDTSVLGGHMNLFGDAPPVKGKRKGIKGSALELVRLKSKTMIFTNYNNMYDQVLGGEDQSERNFGWTAPKTTGEFV